MKLSRSITQSLLFAVAAAGCTFAQAPQAINNSTSAYGQLPLVFEPNVGQTDPRVRFLTRTKGMAVFFTDSEAVMVLRSGVTGDLGQDSQAVIRMRLMGALAPSETQGLDKLPGASNYFIGNNKSAWHTDIPQYGRVRHAGIYPGVDLVYYGNNRKLEYDFVVAPDADPRQVQIAWDGVDAVNLNDAGDLVLKTPLGDVVQKRPRVYQDTNSGRVEIAASYVLAPHHRVTFAMARYDHSRPLVIDPVIVYSNYLGGSSGEQGHGIAVDSCGYAYVTGSTPSSNFPGTPVDGSNNSGKQAVYSDDAFVTKFSMDGTYVVYSTYFGGFGNDHGFGIAVDSTGAAYVTGDTNSSSTYASNQFPQQAAFQGTYGGGNWDAFVTKLSPSGNALVYSTYLGGTGEDQGLGIAVDSTGAAYITGYTMPGPNGSAGFPVLNAYQTSNASNPPDKDAFVTKLTPAGALAYSTYLGGAGQDSGYGIAVDSAGSAYVTGVTYSTNFPTISAFQAVAKGGDAFVTKLSPAGNSLVYSTYLGGTGEDFAFGIAVDASGSAYVTGTTKSFDFPIQGAYQPALNKNDDAFLTKLSPAGNTLVYSTYLGGSGNEQGYAVAVDSSGYAYVAGYATNDILGQPSPPAGDNGFVAKLTPAGNGLVYATYLGGSGNDYANAIAVDSTGAAYVTGTTGSTDFMGVSRANTDSDAFVTKLTDNPVTPPQPAQITSPIPGGMTGGACVIFVWNTAPLASSYRIDVGTAPGTSNYFSQNVGQAPSQTVCGLPTNGAHVYVRLTTNFPCFSTYSDYVYTGGMMFVWPGTVAVMQTPVPGSNMNFQITTFAGATFTWSAGSQATSYKLDVGTWPGVGNVYSHNVGLATKATVQPLPVPATIYVRLTTMLAGGGQVYYDYTYTTSHGIVKF